MCWVHKNVMQAYKENNVKKILHISTDEIYGEILKEVSEKMIDLIHLTHTLVLRLQLK